MGNIQKCRKSFSGPWCSLGMAVKDAPPLLSTAVRVATPTAPSPTHALDRRSFASPNRACSGLHLNASVKRRLTVPFQNAAHFKQDPNLSSVLWSYPFSISCSSSHPSSLSLPLTVPAAEKVSKVRETASTYLRPSSLGLALLGQAFAIGISFNRLPPYWYHPLDSVGLRL